MDREERMRIGYLALDSVLGEEEVDRWVSTIEWSGDAPTAPHDVDALRARVAELRASAPRTVTWTVLKSEDAIAIRREFGIDSVSVFVTQ